MRSTSESVTRPAPRAKCTERLAQRAARGAETRSFHRVFRRQKQLWDRNQSEEVLDQKTNLFSFLIFMPFMPDKLQSPTAPSSCDWTRHRDFLIRKSLPGVPRAFAKKTECSWRELGRILAQLHLKNPNKYHKSPGIFWDVSPKIPLKRSDFHKAWQSGQRRLDARIATVSRAQSLGHSWIEGCIVAGVVNGFDTSQFAFFLDESSYIFETNFWTSYPCFITFDDKFAQRMLKVSERSCSTSTWRFPCLPGRLGADDHVRSDLSF